MQFKFFNKKEKGAKKLAPYGGGGFALACGLGQGRPVFTLFFKIFYQNRRKIGRKVIENEVGTSLKYD